MNSDGKRIRLKCRFDGEIRTVILQPGCSFQQLKKRLSQDFGFEVSMKYEDPEGDLIILSSQNDFDDLLIGEPDIVNVHIFESTLPDLSKRGASRGSYPASSSIFPTASSLGLPQSLPTPTALPTGPAVSGSLLTSVGSASALTGRLNVNTASSTRPIASANPMMRMTPTARSQIERFPSIDGHNHSTTPADMPIRWKRGEILGQGAFGIVYLGLNMETGELMAVKQMAVDEVASKTLSSLENEIFFLRSLRHPNIVRYIDTEITPTALSIFLEYVPGGSLKSLVDKFGQLEESVAKSYTRQLLLGLEYLHRNGIAHRDIKGGNCLVGNDGVIKLADFGNSKHWRPADPSAMQQASGDIKGTPSWMAPEVIRDQGGAIQWKKADIWSIACTTIEMTTGKPPWSQFNNSVTILYHIACQETIPEYPSHASVELITFLNTCLQRDPTKRPDAISLLLHPFVSTGTGWNSASYGARPSTVSSAIVEGEWGNGPSGRVETASFRFNPPSRMSTSTSISASTNGTFREGASTAGSLSASAAGIGAPSFGRQHSLGVAPGDIVNYSHTVPLNIPLVDTSMTLNGLGPSASPFRIVEDYEAELTPRVVRNVSAKQVRPAPIKPATGQDILPLSSSSGEHSLTDGSELSLQSRRAIQRQQDDRKVPDVVRSVNPEMDHEEVNGEVVADYRVVMPLAISVEDSIDNDSLGGEGAQADTRRDAVSARGDISERSNVDESQVAEPPLPAFAAASAIAINHNSNKVQSRKSLGSKTKGPITVTPTSGQARQRSGYRSSNAGLAAVGAPPTANSAAAAVAAGPNAGPIAVKSRRGRGISKANTKEKDRDSSKPGLPRTASQQEIEKPKSELSSFEYVYNGPGLDGRQVSVPMPKSCPPQVEKGSEKSFPFPTSPLAKTCYVPPVDLDYCSDGVLGDNDSAGSGVARRETRREDADTDRGESLWDSCEEVDTDQDEDEVTVDVEHAVVAPIEDLPDTTYEARVANHYAGDSLPAREWDGQSAAAEFDSNESDIEEEVHLKHLESPLNLQDPFSVGTTKSKFSEDFSSRGMAAGEEEDTAYVEDGKGKLLTRQVESLQPTAAFSSKLVPGRLLVPLAAGARSLQPSWDDNDEGKPKRSSSTTSQDNTKAKQSKRAGSRASKVIPDSVSDDIQTAIDVTAFNAEEDEGGGRARQNLASVRKSKSSKQKKPQSRLAAVSTDSNVSSPVNVPVEGARPRISSVDMNDVSVPVGLASPSRYTPQSNLFDQVTRPFSHSTVQPSNEFSQLQIRGSNGHDAGQLHPSSAAASLSGPHSYSDARARKRQGSNPFAQDRHLDGDASAAGISISGSAVQHQSTSSDIVAEDSFESPLPPLPFEFLHPITLDEHAGAVTKLRCPSKTNLLVSGSTDGTVKVWNGVTSETSSKMTLDANNFSGGASKGVSGSAAAAAAAPVGGIIKVATIWAEDHCAAIWAACSDGGLRVWNGSDGRAMRYVKAHEEAITALEGYSDVSSGLTNGVSGQYTGLVGTGSVDKTVRIWDVRAKKPQAFLFRGHSDTVVALRWGDGGRTVLSASKDKTVRIWDTRAGRLRVTLERHFGAVNALRAVPEAFSALNSADSPGVAFVSAGRDSMLNLWSEDGECLATLTAHRGTVNFLSEVGSELQLKANTAQAAPSSSLMLSTGSDNVVKVWDLKRMKAVSEINTAGWGSLTKAVWAGPAVVACTNSGSVRLLQYAPSLTVAVAVPVMSNGADAAAVAAGMQFADDASISSLQGGKADWTSKEMGAHGQACTDLLSTRSFVASASKSGQIFKWIRL